MKYAYMIGILLLTIPTTAQEYAIDITPMDTLVNNYRKLTEQDRFAPLKNVSDPSVSGLKAVAERALKKAELLVNLHKTLDAKLVELLSSDVGRWVATDDNAVKLFITFDLDRIEFSDAAISDRIQRIQSAIRVLEAVRGPLATSDLRAVKMLMLDASWIEAHHQNLDARLNIVADYTNRFPRNQRFDWSKLPTLRDAKAALRAQIDGLILRADFEGLEQARQEGVDERRKQAFEREMKKMKAELQGKQELAALTVKHIQAQFQVEIAVKQKQIQEKELQKEQIQRDTREAAQLAELRKLRAYLQTPRVANLLAPFSGPGRTVPRYHRSVRPDYDRSQLEAGPMSYASIQKILSLNVGDAKRMDYLTAIANDPQNDRPASWGIGDLDWRNAKHDFQNMNGQLVNRYIEAFRILRQHGTLLVELGILRP